MSAASKIENESVLTAAQAVRALRGHLLDDFGFQIANAAGELVNPLSKVWLATTYAGGEYELTAWVRSREEREGQRVVVRVTDALLHAHPGYLDGFQKCLARGRTNYDGPGRRA